MADNQVQDIIEEIPSVKQEPDDEHRYVEKLKKICFCILAWQTIRYKT